MPGCVRASAKNPSACRCQLLANPVWNTAGLIAINNSTPIGGPPSPWPLFGNLTELFNDFRQEPVAAINGFRGSEPESRIESVVSL